MQAAMLFGAMFFLMLIGVPIAFSIELSSSGFLFFTELRPLILVAQRIANGMDSFPLLAVPLFILAGNLMETGGISKRLIRWSETLVGGMPGGVGMVTIVACTLFAALTGSGPATVAAIGTIMIPSMLKSGYSHNESAGLVAAAGALGPIIPPSIPLIMYGVTMNLSIPKMFMAGILPGIFIAALLMMVNYWRATRPSSTIRYDKDHTFTLPVFLRTTATASGALLMPVIILGGIYGGIFTPTEAAAVGVGYSVCVSVFVYREMTYKGFLLALRRTVETSGMSIFITASAAIFGWILSATKMPTLLAGAVITIVDSQFVYILMLNIVLFIVGALMDTIAAIIILAPILVPIGIQLGLDELHLGMFFVINLVIGYVTPPFGYNLFTAVAITKLRFEDVVKGVLPYLIVQIIAVLIIAYVPQICLFLPNLLLR
ncbi:TRAP transporter, DctM subunit [uncultured delta proteobacterium]|uniref:TRAP transporter, DctM subunit n=1 Tax=uncultured delta proteobacterium TaxID=34034 RepID=A0A212JD05_9DELT|nr:TRAP transporter, DctM subunit [uncultured delta proteobacterium]